MNKSFFRQMFIFDNTLCQGLEKASAGEREEDGERERKKERMEDKKRSQAIFDKFWENIIF